MTPLRSKLAVVTGGSQGIGKATCWALAREGCRVVVIARTSADVTGLVQELCDDGHDAVAAPCDLSDSQAATVLFDRLQSDHGGVDILVNCAGVGDFGRFENATMEQLDLPVDVPLKLTLYACRLAVARMIAKGNGVIINVLTPASYFTLPNMAAYSASRWGLRGFTMSLHQELKHSGIHVGSICPGKVGTDYIANNDTDIRWWPRVSRFFPEQSPDEVAKHIVRAVKRRKRETIFPLAIVVVCEGPAVVPWHGRLVSRTDGVVPARIGSRREEHAIPTVRGGGFVCHQLGREHFPECVAKGLRADHRRRGARRDVACGISGSSADRRVLPQHDALRGCRWRYAACDAGHGQNHLD